MGIDIQITLKDDREIRGVLKRLRKIWKQRPMISAMEESLEILTEAAKLYAPVYNGDLRDSIMSSSVELSDTEYTGSIWSDSPYAVAQEQGVPAGYWMNMDNMTNWVLDKWGESSFEPPGFELAIFLFEHGIEAKWYFERAIQENELDIVRKHFNAVEVVITSRG